MTYIIAIFTKKDIATNKLKHSLKVSNSIRPLKLTMSMSTPASKAIVWT